jgi:hypothetical protein
MPAGQRDSSGRKVVRRPEWPPVGRATAGAIARHRRRASSGCRAQGPRHGACIREFDGCESNDNIRDRHSTRQSGELGLVDRRWCDRRRRIDRGVGGAGQRAAGTLNATGRLAVQKGDTLAVRDAIVGVSDHGGWAIFVTVARDGTLLDRRRVELVDESLPKIPHHSEGQRLPIDDAVALVERVRASAERHAALALDSVASAVPHIAAIALRNCPQLPASIAERITDYRARNVADWVMYRKALASAAEARGWRVHWYDAKKVLSDAGDLPLRKAVGPPWTSDHKLAMAAALASTKELNPSR